MQIDVTQDDLDQGIPCSSNRCAVARAVARACKTAVVVGTDWVFF